MKKTRKFLICASAVATMLAATFATSVSASDYHFRGDVNNDGNINVADVASLQGYLNGTNRAEVTRESADVNKDGKVDNSDLNLEKSIVIGDDKQTLFVKGANKEFRAGQVFLNNGKYWGIMQTDGNVVVYRRDGGTDTAVFNTGTNFNEDFVDYKIVFQSDGNIVLYAKPNYPGASARPIWNIGKHIDNRTYPYMLSFDTDGQLLWSDKSDPYYWKSNSNPSNNPAPNGLTFEERKKVAKYRVENNFKYSSYEKAAIDFIFVYNSRSIVEKREYGTSIDKVTDEKGNIKYVLDMEPKLYGEVRTGPTGKGPDIMFGSNTVAYVHTHGHYVVDANNWFSITPNEPEDESDISLAYKNPSGHRCVAYLGAPNGDIRVFDPDKDYVKSQSTTGRVIYYNAPHDPCYIKGHNHTYH